MTEPIIYLDRSQIREGKLDELRRAATELAAFADEHEPQLLSYGFYINEEANRMTVVAIHPDPASMDFHMEVAGPAFRKFADLVELQAIEVYGRPSDDAVSRLRDKALALGGGREVGVEELYSGFARLRSAKH